MTDDTTELLNEVKELVSVEKSKAKMFKTQNELANYLLVGLLAFASGVGFGVYLGYRLGFYDAITLVKAGMLISGGSL